MSAEEHIAAVESILCEHGVERLPGEDMSNELRLASVILGLRAKLEALDKIDHEPVDGEMIDRGVRFVYTNYQQKVEERVVVPRALRWGSTEWHPEVQWHLEAFDVGRSAPRSFALTSIFGIRAASDRPVESGDLACDVALSAYLQEHHAVDLSMAQLGGNHILNAVCRAFRAAWAQGRRSAS